MYISVYIIIHFHRISSVNLDDPYPFTTLDSTRSKTIKQIAKKYRERYPLESAANLGPKLGVKEVIMGICYAEWCSQKRFCGWSLARITVSC